MGIFDYTKKEYSEWRDENGNIRCPGDDCIITCEDGCPIWYHTMGLSLIQMGAEEEAIDYFKKALTIAPDYKEAWSNMATAYGRLNKHLEANKAYHIAYNLDNSYEKALWGLIASCKNLGQFEEALQYCDEYALTVDEEEAEFLRARVKEAREDGGIVRQESALDMALAIVECAREKGLLPRRDHLQYIPELLIEAKAVCHTLFEELIKLEDGRKIRTWLSWSAYAGMGAVIHWYKDWDALKEKGIAETLLEPRGAFAMDEYVIDTIGVGFNTPEGQKLCEDICYLSLWAGIKFMEDPPKKEAAKIALEAMQAMYIFGMVFEMNRLGME